MDLVLEADGRELWLVPKADTMKLPKRAPHMESTARAMLVNGSTLKGSGPSPTEQVFVTTLDTKLRLFKEQGA